MSARSASHAGSWYSSQSSTLSNQLDGWLDDVDDEIKGVDGIPQPGARAIIAPHAGYSYSGPAAAWAYKLLDLAKAKRLFLLGPSHHMYLPNCALSQCKTYETPLGDLRVDTEMVTELHKAGKFDKMSLSADEDEHSLEMHLPYIYKAFTRAFKSPAEHPPIVPILVGSTSASTESTYGKLLAPYLADPTNVFVISSDFCHWGSRFSYTYYLPTPQTAAADGISLRSASSLKSDVPIHESIGRLDRLSMDAIESGNHKDFLTNLKDSGNTVCGRHPIGVIMAGLEHLRSSSSDNNKNGEGKGLFKFVRYEKSDDVTKISGSSVSYASAYAVF